MTVYIKWGMLGQISWKNSGSRDMKENAHGQSDCSIFKSTISQEKIDEKDRFFAC